MRLGDLDALKAEFQHFTWGPYDPLKVIDDMPTVACERCTYHNNCEIERHVRESQMFDVDPPPFACSRFEEATP